MLEMISAKDQLSIVALSRAITGQHSSTEIADLAKILKVPLMSEWRNRQTIPGRLAPVVIAPDADLDREKQLAVAKTLIAHLMERSSAIQNNEERNSYAPWFKQLATKALDDGASYKTISFLTGVSEDNLPRFRKDANLLLIKEPCSDDHRFIEKAWHEARPKQRWTLDHFWTFLGRNYPHSKISRDKVCDILLDLGLRHPRSKKAKNRGAQVKTEFCPNAIWEGDGKGMIIRMGGVRYDFCWYCFVDQDTTLIVGSNIGRFESGALFLGALKDARNRHGVLAYGVLMDNRLGERDLSPVAQFCREHGITIIRSFPGNPKSNGLIENNFSTFDKFVGEINITGTTREELAASIARTVIEIFTQQRNHAPRRRFGNFSPVDRATTDRPPEYVRTAVEKLAARFNVEAQCAEIRWQMIKEARQHFGDLTEKSLAKIMRQLVKYPFNDLLSAQIKYLAQIRKHPTNTYRAEYFMAILRNTREEEAKQAYIEAFRSGLETMHELVPPNQRPLEELTADILDFIVETIEEPSPNRRMSELDAFGWWLVQYSADRSLPELWTAISKAAKESILISLKSWTEISDYLMRRVGKILVIEPPSRRDLSS